MIEGVKIDSVIHAIVQKYPQQEWLERCRDALPQIDDTVILTAIEIFCGGDVIALKGS